MNNFKSLLFVFILTVSGLFVSIPSSANLVTNTISKVDNDIRTISGQALNIAFYIAILFFAIGMKQFGFGFTTSGIAACALFIFGPPLIQLVKGY